MQALGAARLTGRRIAVSAAAFIVSAAAGTSASYAEYPERPINWVVMWSAGGGADTATRCLTDELEKILGQKIVIQNITGGGGSAGYLAAKASKPDGYNLVTIQADLPKFKAIGAAPIDIDDFDIIGSHAVQSPVFAVRTDSPWDTLEEFIAEAKKRPDELTVGVSDLYGGHNQPVVLFEDLAGVQLRNVAHPGSQQMTAAILGGHVDMVSNWVRPTIPHVEDGKLKFLAYAASERHEDYQDVPTLKELGYDVVLEFPYGVGGPVGMPDEAKAVLSSALEKAWDIPAVKECLATRGLSLFTKDGDSFRQHLHDMQQDVIRAVDLVKQDTN